MILVDTNIWGRLADLEDSLHLQAMNAMKWLIRYDHPAVAAQSLYEFWVVATRPIAQNGLEWSPARARKWIEASQRTCKFLPESSQLFGIWSDLVTSHATKGKPAHDARLVAFARYYGISQILTFNIGDFPRYGITVLDPKTIPIV